MYSKAGFELTEPPMRESDPKGIEYGACRFSLNNKKIVYRIGKNTPDRPGYFATMWKRAIKTKEIIPFDYNDDIDYLIIDVDSVSDAGEYFCGQFIFDRQVLLDKKLMQNVNNNGKLATRVFPPWSEKLAKESIERSIQSSLLVKKTQNMSNSAKSTQKWQLNYFISVDENYQFDMDLLKKLLK